MLTTADNKKLILVTGGAGHVGSHLIEQLLTNPQNQVISLDNYSNGTQANHIDGAVYRHGHTKDIDRLVPETPDLIFHLGEYARIAPSFDEPEKVFDFNLAGTQAVVEFSRRRKVGKLIYAGSSTKFAIEGDGRNQNPYSYTKAANVDLINNYGRWYGLPYAICYFYNAYGPRENGKGKYATVIAKFEQCYLKGQPLPVSLPGTQMRNFTYVGDLARGIIAVGENGVGDGYSLSNNSSYSILEVAEAFDTSIEFIDDYSGRRGTGEIPTRARADLGWDTTVDVIDYIHEFVKNHPR
jgi:UDP-glucose 4-epimerase